MNNKLIIRLFIALAAIQLVIPLSMIIKREIVLKDGKQFKFKVAPVDPYDAFRGRYVALGMEEDSVPDIDGIKFDNDQLVYALLGLDDEGFAKLVGVSQMRPLGDYIKAKIRYVANNKIYLDLLLNRYYMEEKSAPKAEQIYREHVRQDRKNAYLLVRIKNGISVPEGLFIEGKRIEDLIKAGI